MLADRRLSSDLNLEATARLSGAMSWLLVGSLLAAALWSAHLLWVSAVSAISLLALNRSFYGFLRKRRGWWFAVRAVPLHWLYYLYSVVAFAAGTVGHLAARESGPDG